MNLFNKKPIRSTEEISKDIIDYLQKKMKNSNYENCFTYKEKTKNKWNIFASAPVNEYIPEPDFENLDAEMKSKRLHIFEIAEDNNLFKRVENTTHNFTPLTGQDYYMYDNTFRYGFYKIGKYSHTVHHAGISFNNYQSQQQRFFKLTPSSEAKPARGAVYEYNNPDNAHVIEADNASTINPNDAPGVNETDETVIDPNNIDLGIGGGKPKKTRRKKNKKRRSSKRHKK
jgi:hypothetical protein